MDLRKLTITKENRIYFDGEEFSDCISQYHIDVCSDNDPRIARMTATFLVQIADIGIPTDPDKKTWGKENVNEKRLRDIEHKLYLIEMKADKEVAVSKLIIVASILLNLDKIQTFVARVLAWIGR